MPIHHSESAPPPSLPPGYTGYAVLPHSRLIYWTGRVAIGLRYERPRTHHVTSAELFAQDQLLPRRAS